MSNLKKFTWTGRRATFFSKRHWNHFFDFAVFLEVQSVGTKPILILEEPIFVQNLFDYVKMAQDDFASFDDWWRFHQASCDRVALDYFLAPGSPDDWFNQRYSQYQNHVSALLAFAKQSGGYVGADSWAHRLPSSYGPGG